MTGTNLLAGAHENYFKIIILGLWPPWALIVVAALGKIIFRLYEKQRLAKSGIAALTR